MITRRYLAPEYNVTTWFNDKVLGTFMKPIPDPFASTTVVIDWRDAVRSILRYGKITVKVIIGGNSDAYMHVMTNRLIEVTDDEATVSE